MSELRYLRRSCEQAQTQPRLHLAYTIKCWRACSKFPWPVGFIELRRHINGRLGNKWIKKKIIPKCFWGENNHFLLFTSSVMIKRKDSTKTGRQNVSGYLCHCKAALFCPLISKTVFFCDHLDNRAAITVGNYCWKAFLLNGSTVTDLTAAKTTFALQRFNSCHKKPISGQKSIWKLGIWDTGTLWRKSYNGTVINRTSLTQFQYCNKSPHKHIFRLCICENTGSWHQ